MQISDNIVSYQVSVAKEIVSELRNVLIAPLKDDELSITLIDLQRLLNTKKKNPIQPFSSQIIDYLKYLKLTGVYTDDELVEMGIAALTGGATNTGLNQVAGNYQSNVEGFIK